MISQVLQILCLQPRISKDFSRSLEQFFLTVGQNNFGNNFGYKIPFFHRYANPGQGKPFCTDLWKDDKCTQMMMAGNCDQTYNSCKRTCGTCNGKCKDKMSSENCKKVMEAGKCKEDKKGMCLMTCYNCGLNGKCKDLMPSKKCKKIMKAGKCENKKIAKKCMKTCDMCEEEHKKSN